ncbi:GNAT family N-acetyltransferase [Actinoplanes flavus]|uniref:GNAT family N-acetyltransferase n=1 Tax=Actinoplanes flavus TaxID=2820290 RepID=A0ABS3US02_9ACTN|nr:GNAT family N-acetyltransferase [Actinoplanes flavus]MBO3741212.1 GNAT family N-acetyltransferase [Actinoplanes flavus]
MRSETTVIREKTAADDAACAALLRRVHARDGYPLFLPPEDVAGFLRPESERIAWVAEHDGGIVGHVALHCPPEDPTLSAASTATGLPPDRLALLARLFTAPEVRRAGLGRALLRHATGHAPLLGRRAVLDVGMSLPKAVALYESEGWSRAGELHIPLDEGPMLDLWVYVSP